MSPAAAGWRVMMRKPLRCQGAELRFRPEGGEVSAYGPGAEAAQPQRNFLSQGRAVRQGSPVRTWSREQKARVLLAGSSPREQLARLSPEIPVVLTAWFCATVLELLHWLVQKLIEQDEECARRPEELAQVKRSLDTPDDTWVTPAPIFCSEPAPAEPGAVCPA